MLVAKDHTEKQCMRLYPVHCIPARLMSQLQTTYAVPSCVIRSLQATECTPLSRLAINWLFLPKRGHKMVVELYRE